MKKILLLSILTLLFGTVTIFAQRGNRGGARNAGNRTQRTQGQNTQKRANKNRKGKSALRGLGLSNDQKRQVKDIRTNAKENGTDKAAANSQIRAILTEEQAAKYDKRLERKANKRERKKKKRERRKQRREENQNTEETPVTDG